MKRNVLFLLITGFVLFLGACNTPEQGSPLLPPGIPPPNVEWLVGYLLVFPTGDTYPGGEIDLAGRNLLDISSYASVTVDATIYSDEAGTTVATKDNASDNLVQFKLLRATGGWNDNNNICGPAGNNTKYNMNVNGPTVWTVPDGASGIPVKLLLQANWADFPEKVKSIKVNSIAFTAKTSASTGNPVLDVVYGDKITVDGNKITFTNAMYSDAAAIFEFPPTFPTVLTGKTLVIAFSIPDHTPVPSTSGAANVEHQIHIQAANSDKTHFNGQNPSSSNGNVGQKYITLDDTATTGWAENSGTIKVPLNDLLAAANVTADANDCKGPFTLNAIRIANNGTTWVQEDVTPNVTHVRCKSYTLVINSITVQ